MHEGQLEIDDEMVRDLVVRQFPHFGTLPLVRVPSDGTVHAIYRLGDSLAVRLPLLEEFSDALLREAKLLARLAPQLPLRIPELVALGSPTATYRAAWSIVTWMEGRTLADDSDIDLTKAAGQLGEFAVAMREADSAGEESPNQRGRPLGSTQDWTLQSIQAIGDEFDAAVLRTIWTEACSVAEWDGLKTWIHGDLLPGNLVGSGGELSAVIDFGECSIGNPTHDLIAAWWVFDTVSRPVFKQAAQASDEAWSRARGRALGGAAGALAYYRDSNPGFSAVARRTLREVLGDV